METTNRLSPIGLSAELDSVREFTFFQLNDRLQHFTELHNRIHEKPLQIRYRAIPSLAFPAADVDSWEWLEGKGHDSLELTVAFMGLYGPASPLPAYYTERVIQQREPDHPSRDFMDLFNHRTISLLHRCWNKYRYFTRFEAEARDQYSRWLLSLLGLDRETLLSNTRLKWHKLLPFAALVARRGCSEDRLAVIVQQYFGLKSVWLEPWVSRTFVIPHDQCNAMGQLNSAMGVDMILGTDIEDCNSKFNLHFGHLTESQHDGFLPDGEYFMELVELVRFLLQDPLDFDLCLSLSQGDECCAEVLRKHQDRLGWTFQLGDADTVETTTLTCICVADFTQ